MDEEESPITPFTLTIEPEAQENIRDAVDWLQTLPFPDAAERFADMIDRELPGLCYDVAESMATGNLLPRPDIEASETTGRTTYSELIHTGTRRRGSSAGAWRVYYELSDDDGDGDFDTLNVMSILHAARPIGQGNG